MADLAYGWHLMDREVFLCLWIAIFGLLGLYLIGKLKFQSDVVEPGDGLRIVYEFQRLYDDARIHVHPVIELFGSEDDPGDPLSPLEGLALIGQLAGLPELIIGVAAQLRMHAQVLQVGLAEHGPDDVGHGPDPQLQSGPVPDMGQDVLRDQDIFPGGLFHGELGQGGMDSLHHVVHLGDMDALVKASQDPGQVLVDLHDDRPDVAEIGLRLALSEILVQSRFELLLAVDDRLLELL